MRALVVPEPGRVELTEVPEPEYGPYECLVEILTCAFCSGTDTHIIDGVFPGARYPCILGHESVGRVLACGAQVRHYRPGDLVLRPVAVRPGDTLAGYHSYFGGFAERGLVADAAAILADTPRGETPRLPGFAKAQQVVPSDFDPGLGGAFITYKETLSSLYDLGVGPGQSLLVLGSGPVGLNFCLAAKRIGARPVIVVGRRAGPLARALAWGADATVDTSQQALVPAVRELTGDAGVEYAVEAIGQAEILQQGLECLAPGGTVGIYGVAPAPRAALDWSRAAAGWGIRQLRPREETVHAQVLDQMRLGLVALAAQVSHRLPFEAFDEGLRLIRAREATKVVLLLKA